MSSPWSVPAGGTKIADVLDQLGRDRPNCPLCERPITRDHVKADKVVIYSVPVGPTPDRLALMPFHKECWPEAKERLDRAREDVNERARRAREN